MTRHLRFDMYTANDAGEMRHPQIVMREIGISYQIAVPQSVADCWQFWNCTGGPDALPSFLQPFDVDPVQMVGYGLSLEMANAIKAATP